MSSAAGLVELGHLNEAFKPFAYTLFRQDRIGMDIDQQTRTANETVRQSLERLLTLLSPYFMRDAATKVLEYLIRQYRWPSPPITHVQALHQAQSHVHANQPASRQIISAASVLRNDGMHAGSMNRTWRR